MLSKGHVGCPRGTRPVSSIIESSTRPVFDHREKGTLKVYPWLRRVLFKGPTRYPRETRPPSSIVESSTCPVFDHRVKGTFRVYPWMHRVLAKGHLGCPRGTRPPSSIIESSTSTRPVFDHRGKETLRVYPWMCCVLPKVHVAYPGGPWLLLSIVELSTFTVFVASRKELSKSPLDAPGALCGLYGLFGRTMAATFKICPPPAWPPVSRNLFLLHAFRHCPPEVFRIGTWIVLTLLEVNFGVQDIQLNDASSF